MDSLLASLAVLVVTCLACMTGAFFWLRARLREKTAYHGAASIHRFPQRLRLKQLEPFAWRKLSRGPQRVESFQALGFEPLGGFSVDELPGARLFVLQHPASGLLGLVNEHEQLGTWSDVLMFVRGENQPILASGILRHCHFFLLPGSPKIHKHRATEQELADTVKTAAETGSAPLKLTATANSRASTKKPLPNPWTGACSNRCRTPNFADCSANYACLAATRPSPTRNLRA